MALKPLLIIWAVIALVLINTLPAGYGFLVLAVLITISPTNWDPSVRIKEHRVLRKMRESGRGAE